MKYAIISDIHSNFYALKAVLEHIDHQHCDKIICLGDITGYGPAPNECLELIQQKCNVVIAGNHDYGLIERYNLERFNRFAQQALLWTQTVLTENNKKFVQELPLTAELNNLFFVHSSPHIPGLWEYVLTEKQAHAAFDCFDHQFCFIGHSHRPKCFSRDKDITKECMFEEPILTENRYIINVGSVGQPRDGDSRACFGVLDTNVFSFSINRIEYDITQTRADMIEKNLPAFLYERLLHGR